MDSCYSGDHITGDYLHMGITTFNIEEPQGKYRLGTVSIEHSLNKDKPSVSSYFYTGSIIGLIHHSRI